MSYGDGFKRRRVDDEAGKMQFNPSTRYRPTGGREWTVSVAIPTSILSDCATSEQRINSPSRVARALAMFSIDEIVIFDDRPMDSRPAAVDHDAYTGDTDPSHYLFHLLTYMETPTFMRKSLFPLHPNLRLQGLFPNLDMPHHIFKDEHLPYMEGLTVAGKPDSGKKTVVDVGLRKTVSIKEEIPPKTRVTLHFPTQNFDQGEAVDPAAPRTDAGYYWGYQVRQTSSLSNVFTESPYEGGYDVSIGTSERGLPTSKAFANVSNGGLDFQHLLIVFGGPRGLEYAAMNDDSLAEVGINKANIRDMFDHWVDVLPNQGTRNIRTDEAIFVALAEFRRLWSGV